MEVAKSFDRAGKRYRSGDPLPPDLDKLTLEHYKRHGMVRESSAKPENTKPAAPRRRTAPGPTQTKPASPTNTGAIEPVMGAGLLGDKVETDPSALAGAALFDQSEGDESPADSAGAGDSQPPPDTSPEG